MNNLQSRIIRIAGAASLALLAACGGGGGSASSLPPSGNSDSAPTPTPAPNSTPVPATNAITVSPNTLSFTSLQSQTFTVTDAKFAGTYSVSGCPGVVKAASANASGSTATFTVTPVAAGTCSLAVSENGGHSATIGITVTITQGTIQ